MRRKFKLHKNKRGSVALVVLFAIVYFMFGVLVMNFIRIDVSTTYSALNCGTVGSLTDGDKITCLIVDGVIPLFIIAILSIAGGYITDRALKR